MRAAIRERFRKALRRDGVDVYIACTPSNFHYLSGYQSAFIDLSWQMSGTDLVVLFADSSHDPAVVVSEYSEQDARHATDIADIRTYPMWTENRDFRTVAGPRGAVVERPEQYDAEAIFALVSKIVTERGLVSPVVGSDLSLMKHETFMALERAFLGHRLVDCRQIAYRVRSIKEPGEISSLRKAARLFDIGVARTVDKIKEGLTAADLQVIFEAALRDAVRCDPELGPFDKTFFFPHLGTGESQIVRRGDIIKLDCGVRVNGYWSDGCRHFSLGPPSAEQLLVHDALRAGFDAALVLIRPGARVRDVFEAAITAVRKNGLPNYSRGHVGHSIGLDDQTEEPPFLGPNDTELSENMMICLELPYYPPDLGGFNIEDMLMVTATGPEALTQLDRGLVELPCHETS
ncbi:putative peptidase [Defluviimonas aquaemixtae]|uniref:Putative peptidase n=1 Tax=Albidovulum aquaemixtae TaxID=1542388 RepID=A0A2R8B3V9_9RHOB|nr:Xaa-Pro peptidase family protein [Defluviimonas aquaemixtae]SPH17275.1 putative peptidase [Defluviimonas aquaemixtae]